MICSEPEVLEHCTKKYIFYLRERGYSDSVINKALNKLKNITRDNMINKNCTDETHKTKCKKCYPFVMKYNVKLPSINKIIKRHEHILTLTKETSELFPAGSIFVSFKVERNIRDILTSSYLRPLHGDAPGMEELQISPGSCAKCGDECKMCRLFLIESTHAWSYHTKDRFQIKGNLSCQTENAVYILQDEICKLSSIGVSTGPVANRWTNHKSHIRCSKKICTVASHFIENSKSCHKLTRDGRGW